LTNHISIEDGRVQATTLSNGFRIVTEHMPHVKSAALSVSATAGARDETIPEGGLSHMLEHMAFKGTTSRSAKQIVEEIENVGGDLNAYTDYEVTAYQARVLAEHVPMAIDLIADILRDSTFDEGEIEKERQVILQEIGERNDMPSMAALETLQETCFPNQALGRPIIGTPQKVLSFDRQMISDYLARHYAPHGPPRDVSPEYISRGPNASFVMSNKPMSRSGSKPPTRATSRLSSARKRRRLFWAAACLRGCSKRPARNAACAIVSIPTLKRSRIPA